MGNILQQKTLIKTSIDEIIAYMVGREITDKFPNVKSEKGTKNS